MDHNTPAEDGIVRLAKKRHKGFLRIIFSRFGLMALLLALEVLLLLAANAWFAGLFQWFSIGQTVFAVLMIFHLFNLDMDATGKLTWLVLIAVVPVPASILLWFTEKDIGHRLAKARITDLIAETRDKLSQDPEVFSSPELVESGTDDLCRYLNRTGNFPVYAGSETEYFPLGEPYFEAVMREITKAERFIFLEFFILDEGYMWGSVLKVLADKAAQGVEVRVIYDGMCEMATLPADYSKRLASLGIKAKPFMRLSPFLSTLYNYRDHRKILVVDGNVAFTGGVNLADEYINRTVRFGHWKDTAVMIKGDAVKSFTLMFLQIWNISEKEPRWDEYLTPAAPCSGDGYVMPYSDCPLDGHKVGEMVYMDILNRAKSYVHIMTPYLILDNELEVALKFAAERGVDVKIILPGIPDKKLAYALAKSHYRSLTEAGVKLYEYTPGFVHAKVFSCDGEKAVVGTINLDYRSLYHHFECAAYLYRTRCIQDIEADFTNTLARCRQVTEDSIRREKLYYQIVGRIMKLIAPLM